MLLKFLCNISLISFMEMKMFKPRSTMMMISNICDTQRKISQINAPSHYLQNTKRMSLFIGNTSFHLKLPATIFADKIGKTTKNHLISLNMQDHGKPSPQGVFPLPPTLLLLGSGCWPLNAAIQKLLFILTSEIYILDVV